MKSEIIANEIFKRIEEFGRKRFAAALETSNRLSDPDRVGDGELLDALFTFTSHLDLNNPLLPVCHEMFKRYMDKIGMLETPMGIKKEWEYDDMIAERQEARDGE